MNFFHRDLTFDMIQSLTSQAIQKYLNSAPTIPTYNTSESTSFFLLDFIFKKNLYILKKFDFLEIDLPNKKKGKTVSFLFFFFLSLF